MLSNKRDKHLDGLRGTSQELRKNREASRQKQISREPKAVREKAPHVQPDILTESLFAPETKPQAVAPPVQQPAPSIPATQLPAKTIPVSQRALAAARAPIDVSKAVLRYQPPERRLFAQLPSLSASEPRNEAARLQTGTRESVARTLAEYSDNPVMLNRFFRHGAVQWLQERGQLRGRWADIERGRGLAPRDKQAWRGLTAKNGRGGRFTWGHPQDDVKAIKEAVQFKKHLQRVAEEQRWRLTNGATVNRPSVPSKAPLEMPQAKTAGPTGLAASKPRGLSSSTNINQPIAHTAPEPAQPRVAAKAPARRQAQQQKAPLERQVDRTVPMEPPTMMRAPQFHHHDLDSTFRAQKALRTALYHFNGARKKLDSAIRNHCNQFPQDDFSDVRLDEEATYPHTWEVHEGPNVAIPPQFRAKIGKACHPRPPTVAAHEKSSGARIPAQEEMKTQPKDRVPSQGRPQQQAAGYKQAVHVRGPGFVPVYAQGRVSGPGYPYHQAPPAPASAAEAAYPQDMDMDLSRVSAGTFTQLPHSITQPAARVPPQMEVPWVYSQQPVEMAPVQWMPRQSALRAAAPSFQPGRQMSYYYGMPYRANLPVDPRAVLAATNALLNSEFMTRFTQVMTTMNALLEHQLSHMVSPMSEAEHWPSLLDRHPSQRKPSFWRWRQAPGGIARPVPFDVLMCSPAEFGQLYDLPHEPRQRRYRVNIRRRLEKLMRSQPCLRKNLHQQLETLLNGHVIITPMVRTAPSAPVDRRFAEEEGRRRGEPAPVHVLHSEDEPLRPQRAAAALVKDMGKRVSRKDEQKEYARRIR